MKYLLRDLPPELHHRMKVEAARQGLTLKQFMLGAFEAQVNRAEVERKLGITSDYTAMLERHGVVEKKSDS